MFCEYLVAVALGVDSTPRVEWDRWDLTYRGVGIEVKATGWVQSWAPPVRPPAPRFDIAPKRGWDAATNKFQDVPSRLAQVWVFAECTSRTVDSAHVADPGSWQFHVVSGHWLDENMPTQKQIGLTRLPAIVAAVTFDDLRAAVDEVIDS